MIQEKSSTQEEPRKTTVNTITAGDGSRMAVGGNYMEKVTIQEMSSSFSTITFNDEENHPEPSFMEEIYTDLKENRVIILSGNTALDEGNFALQVVKKISEKQTKCSCLRLTQNQNNEELSNRLSELDGENVVLLNNLHPRNIKHDFQNILNLAESKKSYYVITTEFTEEVWKKAGPPIENHWFSIPEEDHYDLDALTNWFVQRIKLALPVYLEEDTQFDQHTIIGENIRIFEIVKLLPFPEKLILFLNRFKRFKTKPSDIKIKLECRNLSKGLEEVISKWFNNLDQDEKHIALCVALFNGLYCGQIFELMRKLVSETFWKVNNGNLVAIDYYNLDFLLSFCSFQDNKEGIRILAKSNYFRIYVINVAKSSFSRHLEQVIRVFKDVSQNTYELDYTENWELFGTLGKRGLLRQTFIHSIRDLGMTEIYNVEPTLLELASSKNAYVQGLAAKSLAQYRAFNKEELLFETLNKWLTNEKIQARINLFIRDFDTEENFENTAAVYVKQTVIRTLSEAADYDQPNALDDRIIKYLIQFSEDSNLAVRYALEDSLPKFIHHHSFQLKDLIFDQLISKPELNYGISIGLKFAYEDYPLELKKIIFEWLEIVSSETSQDNRRKKATGRDNTLITILLMFRHIDLTIKSGFTIEEIYDIAIPLLKEKRPAVLEQVVLLIAHLQVSDFDLAFKKISATIERFPKKYKEIIVKFWASIYLDQRAKLEGSPYYVKINKKRYPAWLSLRERPLTSIEKAMFTWINSHSKTAQTYATLAFLEFSRVFEHAEYKELKQLNALLEEKEYLRTQNETSFNGATDSGKSTIIGLSPSLRMKIFFSLLFESKENRAILKEIIQLFMNSNNYTNSDLQLVIIKWSRGSEGELATKLSKWLKRFL